MKKYYFVLRSNSAVNRIGGHGIYTYWTDQCRTKKEVREKYGSKKSHGSSVIAVYSEEQFLKAFGVERANQIERYWSA